MLETLSIFLLGVVVGFLVAALVHLHQIRQRAARRRRLLDSPFRSDHSAK